MNALGGVIHALAGLFVDDGLLALKIVVVVLLAGTAAKLIPGAPLGRQASLSYSRASFSHTGQSPVGGSWVRAPTPCRSRSPGCFAVRLILLIPGLVRSSVPRLCANS